MRRHPASRARDAIELAGSVVEHLLELGGAVLADVASLGREDDVRVALCRNDDVRIAMDDLEAGHVRDGTLEPRVLASGDDQCVEVVLRPSRL